MKKNPKNNTESNLTTSESRKKWVWWLLSPLLHLIIFGLFVWLTPARRILFKQEPELTMRAERIEELAEIADDLSADYMKRQGEIMEYILEQMKEVEQEKYEEYQEIEEKLELTTSDEVLLAQREALKSQEEVLKNQNETETSKAQQQVTEAQEKINQTLTQQSDKYSGELKKLQKKANKAQVKANKMYEQTSKKLKETTEERLPEQKKKADTNLEKKQEAIEQIQREAYNAQKKAHKLQLKAYNKLAKPEIEQPKEIDFSKLDIAELYETAVEIEEDITYSYRNVRAADVAMLRQVTFSEAKEAVDVVKPERLDLGDELRQKNIRTSDGLKKRRETVETAMCETDSMIELAYNLLMLAEDQKRRSTEGYTTSFDWIMNRAKRDEKLRELAKEKSDQRAEDLTEAMKAVSDEGHVVEKEVPPDSSSDVVPQRIDKDAVIIPGRKVKLTGDSAEWMFVDSWYSIGPFPNPKRKNIDHKFPPETVADLDASYIGKNGKVVKWEFMQSGKPKVTPLHEEEYAIYYEYTELYFDKPCDLWVAVGSDDKSTLWINDYPVWISVSKLKGWRIDEGFRKVHFKKGINRVLYRVENGWQACDFSLLIRVNPEL